VRGERLEVGDDKIRSFEDLVVYQKGYELVLKSYQLTATFPMSERYELGHQIRKAAVSIPANIAEGYGRKDSKKEFRHFLRNALGSANEMMVLLKLSKDLGYMADDSLIAEYDVLGKQLFKLIARWK